MELKHTPRPWEKDHIKSISKHKNDNTPTVADNLTLEELEANGRLIASASEMLEMMINSFKQTKIIVGDNYINLIKMDEKSDAYKMLKLIEKATGFPIEEVLK